MRDRTNASLSSEKQAESIYRWLSDLRARIDPENQFRISHEKRKGRKREQGQSKPAAKPSIVEMPVKIAWNIILGSGLKNLFENDRLISRGSKGRFNRTATR